MTYTKSKLVISAVLVVIMSASSASFAGGSGTASDPYEIETCTQLQQINLNITADYELVSNVDCSGTSSWNSGKGFKPVTNHSVRYNDTLKVYGGPKFNGSLDGNNHFVEGLFIDRPNVTGVGIIGVMESPGNVTDIGVVNATVTGERSVGGIIGQATGGVGVSGAWFKGNITGLQEVGGIVGENHVPIDSSLADANISASQNRLGGIAGLSSAPISDSYTRGYLDGNKAGGIVGASNSGVWQSHSEMDVSTKFRGGGLVGQIDGGTVNNSFARGDVTGGFGTYDEAFGGLIGSAPTDTATAVKNSYATGNVTGGTNSGGLIGDNSSTGLVVQDSYWDEIASGQSSSDGGTGLSTSEMTYPDAISSMNFDFSNIWVRDDESLNSGYPCISACNYQPSIIDVSPSMSSKNVSTSINLAVRPYDYERRRLTVKFFNATDDTQIGSTFSNVRTGENVSVSLTGLRSGEDYSWYVEMDDGERVVNSSTYSFTTSFPGSGTNSDPYEIDTCRELENIDNYRESSFELVSDIDCDGTSTWHGGSGFSPIAVDHWSESNRFRGEIYGRGHIIDNMFIKRSGRDYVALIAAADADSLIRNFSMRNVDIAGDRYVGGVAGYATGNITDVYVTGNVTGNALVGGIAGRTAGVVRPYPTIKNSGVLVNVSGNEAVGGLAGVCVGDIVGNSASGKVREKTVSGNGELGGLCGVGVGSYIRQSFSNATVTGGSDVGGLIGDLDGLENSYLARSYATGNVSGNIDVGGLVGEVVSGSSVNLSYAAGNVSGSTNVGGLIGNYNQSGGNFSTNYWNINSTGQSSSALSASSSVGLYSSQITGVSACEMMSFNFQNVWSVKRNGGPQLQALEKESILCRSNGAAPRGALWVQSDDLRWANGSLELWIKGSNVFNKGLLAPAGGLWVQNKELRWISQGNDERGVKGKLIGPSSGPAGALWFQEGFIHYVDQNGDERVIGG